jgi:hypothetical protein
MSKKIPIPKNAHLVKALISGEVITIMDGFKRFGITNIPREISRLVEQKFEVTVSRDRVEFKTDLGLPGFYFRYRLNFIESNVLGIQRMHDYLQEYFPTPKEQVKETSQSVLF